MSNKEYKNCQKVFRVWDGKQMYYSGNIRNTYFICEMIPINQICEHETMLWVGKIDINLKKIYEGDIIKFKDPTWSGIIYGQVVFNHDDCQFEVRNLKRWTYHDKSFSYQDHEFCRIYEIEVIGNVYENPNMLIEYDDIPQDKKVKNN
jgi:uncharacterized phage protein (TIGR01671 family)